MAQQRLLDSGRAASFFCAQHWQMLLSWFSHCLMSLTWSSVERTARGTVLVDLRRGQRAGVGVNARLLALVDRWRNARLVTAAATR
jgi:hypothetical protein